MSTMRSIVVASILCTVGLAWGQATKVGPGVQVVPRAAAPGKDAPNSAYWTNSADANKPYYTTPAGVSSPLMTASASTLAATYVNGAVAADQTLLVQAADGGPLICKANAAATGTLLQTQTSGGTPLVTFTDNSTNTLTSAMPDGAAAIALQIATTTTWSNAAAKLIDAATSVSSRFSLYASGLIESSWARNIGTAQTPGLSLGNTTAAAAGAQQFSPMARFIGQGWKTDAAAASQAVEADIQVRPVQGAAAPSGILDFLWGINGAAPAVQAGLNSAGNFLGSGIYDLTFTGGFGIGATATTFWGGSLSPGANLGSSLGTSGLAYTELYTRHIVGKSAAAPTCATQAAMGAGGSLGCTVTGNDLDFQVNMTTGAAGAGNGAWAVITFNTAYNAAPKCTMSGAAATAQSSVIWAMAVEASASTANTIQINANATVYGADTLYPATVHCIE